MIKLTRGVDDSTVVIFTIDDEGLKTLEGIGQWYSWCLSGYVKFVAFKFQSEHLTIPLSQYSTVNMEVGFVFTMSLHLSRFQDAVLSLSNVINFFISEQY